MKVFLTNSYAAVGLKRSAPSRINLKPLWSKVQFVQSRTASESQLRSQKLVAENADQGLADDEVLLDHRIGVPRYLLVPFLYVVLGYHISSISTS